MKLLFGTRNPGKLKEAQALLKGLDLELLSPDDFSQLDGFDVDETGATLEENALLKATTFAKKTGVISCSDDSGLEVVALDGRPGVHSKRFISGSDEDRNNGLLQLLELKNDRTAQFRTVLCLFDPKSEFQQLFEGKVTGTIADQPRGSQGFGYDPVFIPDGYEQTFAELGIEEKNKLSHRAKAFAALKEYLSSQR